MYMCMQCMTCDFSLDRSQKDNYVCMQCFIGSSWRVICCFRSRPVAEGIYVYVCSVSSTVDGV